MVREYLDDAGAPISRCSWWSPVSTPRCLHINLTLEPRIVQVTSLSVREYTTFRMLFRVRAYSLSPSGASGLSGTCWPCPSKAFVGYPPQEKCVCGVDQCRFDLPRGITQSISLFGPAMKPSRVPRRDNQLSHGRILSLSASLASSRQSVKSPGTAPRQSWLPPCRRCRSSQGNHHRWAAPRAAASNHECWASVSTCRLRTNPSHSIRTARR